MFTQFCSVMTWIKVPFLHEDKKTQRLLENIVKNIQLVS